MARQLVIANQVKTPAQQQINTQNMFKGLGQEIANGITKGNANIFSLNKPGAAVYNDMPMPDSMNFTVSSVGGTGSLTKTIYIFNEDVYNANLTDNGHGANSIVTTYGDGFNGHWYNNALKSYGSNSGAGNQGIRIYGFTVQFFTISTGNQNSSIFSTLNFTWAPYNGYGAPKSVTMDFNQAIRNTQFQDGILTFQMDMFLNAMGQFSMSLPPDTKGVFTFLNKPIVAVS